MKETTKLCNVITKRGTLEILISLYYITTLVRYINFKNTMNGL